jgi:glucose-1-phosphatase
MRFLSHELGLVKPDRAVFEHVAVTLALQPARIVFLDDNAINVAEARSVGFTAVQVRGVSESRSALIALGLLQGH